MHIGWCDALAFCDMKAKRPSKKTPQSPIKSKDDQGLPKLDFTALQVVRLYIDSTIAASRNKDLEVRKKINNELAFDSIDTFQLLSTASKESGNELAGEIASPAMAIVEAISEMAAQARAIATHAKREDWQKAAARVQEQVDFALALILRVLIPTAKALVRSSKNPDLLCETIHILIGNGHEAADQIERYQKIIPDEGLNEDGSVEPESFPDYFAWDAYSRISALEKMIDILPKHIGTAAKQMNAWPMLRYCHNDRKKKFEQIVKTLELGADYPLDVSKRSAWRPDTPMVQYLDILVCRLSAYRSMGIARKKWETKDVKNAERIFIEPSQKLMSEDAVEAVRAGLSSIKKLTKDTAELWANVAIVPYIMATDAKTPVLCSEPALKAIWKQRGVKSAAIFESRLTPLVVRTLKSMARQK